MKVPQTQSSLIEPTLPYVDMIFALVKFRDLCRFFSLESFKTLGQ